MAGKDKKLHASPTKDFFINMITRDIGLDECIFDLLDNSLDGANRLIDKHGPSEQGKPYAGYKAEITISDDLFIIEDNCGGIPLDDAIDYAFHFGRRPDAPTEHGTPIGLYGIGMKRAIFKIGKDITIDSVTENESFTAFIDVDAWSAKTDDWDIDLFELERFEPHGTTITIKDIKDSVNPYFSDPTFKTTLSKDIAKFYSFFLQDGFEIFVNETKINPYGYQLKQSDDFKPIHFRYQDEIEDAVSVEISGGLAGIPPDDTSAETRLPATEYYGWFVLCNDRVVLAGDKSSDTGWGIEPTPNWHPQYHGFMGIVSFYSTNPKLLPWTTTKRELDLTSPVYRRALVKMREVVRQYIDYTNDRKDDIDKAKSLEGKAAFLPVRRLEENKTMKVPAFDKKPTVEFVFIQYQQPKSLVKDVAESLGNRNMTYKKVGIETFKYYIENELGD